jgi:hypothetical protein
MKRKSIYLIVFVSLLLRLYKLGQVPEGLSLLEAKYGILLSDILESHITSLFWIRLPFAILGTISIILFYLVIEKFSKNKKLAIISSLVLTISPWHILESRIFSWGIIVSSLILMIILVFFQLIQKKLKKILNILLILCLAIFAVSIFKYQPIFKNNVDYQRNIAAKKVPVMFTKIYSNKLIESIRYKEKLFIENLDFGNFFFSGYPRQRWGVEESPKLYFLFIPFLLYGFFVTAKNYQKVFTILSVSLFLLLSTFELSSTDWSLPFIYLIIPIISSGFLSFFSLKKKNWLKAFVILILAFEFVYFWQSYRLGYSESQFSSRTKSYQQLSQDIDLNIQNEDSLLIIDRLPNSITYLEYYQPKIIERIQVADYDLNTTSGLNKLFVGVLPFEPSPAEPLFKKDEKWPGHLQVLSVIPDYKFNIDIILFRSKL